MQTGCKPDANRMRTRGGDKMEEAGSLFNILNHECWKNEKSKFIKRYIEVEFCFIIIPISKIRLSVQ